MKKMTYVCDKCKKEKELKYMSAMTVEFNNIRIADGRYTSNRHTFDFCKDCMNKLGLITDTFSESVTQPNVATLEDKLLGLLESAGVKFVED